MNKFMKKAMAAACAMAVVGGVPAAFGTEIFPPALIASAAEGEVTLEYAQVELGGSITLDFYATKSSVDAADVNNVVITGPNGDVDPVVTDNGTNYIYSYDLYATQLGEDVTIQFKKDDTVVNIADKGESFKYTVNEYCDAVEAGSSTDYTDEEKNAAKSLKNLGIASDNYFNNKDTAITFMDSSYDLSSYAPVFATDAKISLVLDSIVKFRVYIDGLTVPEEADLEDSDGNATVYSLSGKNGKACFESTFLYPQYFDEVQTITYNSKTYKASALSYCFRALNSSDVKTQNIGKAAYEYYKYITAYFAL